MQLGNFARGSIDYPQYQARRSATTRRVFVERLHHADYNGRFGASAEYARRGVIFEFPPSTAPQVPWNKTPTGRHDSTLRQDLAAGHTD